MPELQERLVGHAAQGRGQEVVLASPGRSLAYARTASIHHLRSLRSDGVIELRPCRIWDMARLLAQYPSQPGIASRRPIWQDVRVR